MNWGKYLRKEEVSKINDSEIFPLRKALELLTENGVVILHDVERPEYKEGIDLYDIIGEGDGTLCLRPKLPA